MLRKATLLLLAVPALAAATSPQRLRSPWDAPAAPAGSPSTVDCPAPPSLPRDIITSGFYADAAKSVPDPARYAAYRASVKPINDAARDVAKMADAYRTRGDVAAARCVARWLASFARADVLTGKMSSNQAYYVQGWTLGAFAIDWLKVRAAPGVIDKTSEGVPAWLGRVAALNRDYYAGRDEKVDGRNNHRYWAGLAAMAAGIAADRRDEFGWGLQSMQIGLRQVDADGTLPLEMARRAKALHYHLFAVTPLMVMAELAGANRVDVWHENDGALKRLADRALAGASDPAFFNQHAGIEQEPIKRTADNFAWAIPFERRFRDPRLRALLASLPSTSVDYIGGSPPP
jgi:poly(beta-D-mannuronate) lyase